MKQAPSRNGARRARDKMADYIRMILLWLRWEFMSQEKRYVYLWNRTRDER